MHHYSIYGLRVCCNRALPYSDSVSDSGYADVAVELAGMGETSSMPVVHNDPENTHPYFIRSLDQEGNRYVKMLYAGAGHELVFLLKHDGSQVWVTWNDLVGIEDVAALLTGPVFVSLLRLQGRTCLHASVIEIDGLAIALLGSKGAGKTSTALALIQSGGQLLSDDVAVLEHDSTGFTVRVGQPKLRLRPDPAAVLGENFSELPQVWSRGELRPNKRYLELPAHRDQATAVPLHAVYILGARDASATEATLRKFDKGAALPQLMANRHMADIVDRVGHSRDFRTLASLATQTPVYAVHRREGAQFVHETVDVIRASLGQQIAASG